MILMVVHRSVISNMTFETLKEYLEVMKIAYGSEIGLETYTSKENGQVRYRVFWFIDEGVSRHQDNVQISDTYYFINACLTKSSFYNSLHHSICKKCGLSCDYCIEAYQKNGRSVLLSECCACSNREVWCNDCKTHNEEPRVIDLTDAKLEIKDLKVVTSEIYNLMQTLTDDFGVTVQLIMRPGEIHQQAMIIDHGFSLEYFNKDRTKLRDFLQWYLDGIENTRERLDIRDNPDGVGEEIG